MPKRTVRPESPTKAHVRDFFAANPTRQAKLSDRAQHSLVSRGQLAQEAIDEYNKGVKPSRQYVRGNGLAAKAAKASQRASLADQGIAVGKRGPLSKAALAALKG